MPGAVVRGDKRLGNQLAVVGEPVGELADSSVDVFAADGEVARRSRSLEEGA